ncbi:acyltransferase family protein [Pseudonocardia xinjiangensis]|uniref:acyltransferase family protein n=1 Tax=Pseudonocardia xinjiangensis TaxID=75289 RepID=UPI003D94ECC3
MPSTELRGLTGLRIVAAAWVVLFHFHFTPLEAVAEVAAVLGPLITAGALGVDLFFVLSGFVITYTYLDSLGPALRVRATVRFVWARACRIWPVYALVFHLFGIWLMARLWYGSDSEVAFQAVQPDLGPTEYLQQLFMVQLWDNPFFDGASWVGATWSISAEWLAYLLFPVGVLVLFRLRNLPATVLAMAAVALMAPMVWAYLSTGTPYHPWSWAARILCGFSGGAVMYLAVRRKRRTEGLRRGASTAAVVLPVLIAAGLLLGELLGPGRGGAVIALFPLLVGALAVADRGPAMALSMPWAVYGGRVSYSLYLVHIPMFEIYWLALQKFSSLGPGTMLAHVTGVVVLLSTFAVAALAFHAVEEPARRSLRAMARPGDAAQARASRSPRHRAVGGTATGWPGVGNQSATRLTSEAATARSRIVAARRNAAAGRSGETRAGGGPGGSAEVSAVPRRRPAPEAGGPPLAAALINAQRRQPPRPGDYERSLYVQGYLNARG